MEQESAPLLLCICGNAQIFIICLINSVGEMFTCSNEFIKATHGTNQQFVPNMVKKSWIFPFPLITWKCLSNAADRNLIFTQQCKIPCQGRQCLPEEQRARAVHIGGAGGAVCNSNWQERDFLLNYSELLTRSQSRVR